MSGASSRARYNKPITLTSKLPFSIFGSISRKLPQPPPTALWIRTSVVPNRRLTSATTVFTWFSSETSHVIACTSGSSCARRLISSAEPARPTTRNPPTEKRLTMAAPVPGPTPVTITIGLSVIQNSFGLVCRRPHMDALGLRLMGGGLVRRHQRQANRDVLVIRRSRDRIAVAAFGEQVD